MSSLLLFNSVENPYKKYVSVDNLAGQRGHSVDEETAAALDQLFAAPTTVLEGDILPELAGLGLCHRALYSLYVCMHMYGYFFFFFFFFWGGA